MCFTAENLKVKNGTDMYRVSNITKYDEKIKTVYCLGKRMLPCS
jgi:hypothetical protein